MASQFSVDNLVRVIITTSIFLDKYLNATNKNICTIVFTTECNFARVLTSDWPGS